MKFVKGISLFFIYPLLVFGVGVYVGVECTHFFYPGNTVVGQTEELPRPSQGAEVLEESVEFIHKESEKDTAPPRNITAEGQDIYRESVEKVTIHQADVKDVAQQGETLSVDTEYVLKETDIINDSVVETIEKLPEKYIGLNREQFLMAMENYESFPPLSELERGFVSLEVLSFSRERVVVQMNYHYVQPGESFYLAVCDNEVVVYLEDKKTVYIYTGIMLDSLPEELQLEIIQMMWVENEEKLYHFLENYSS